MKGSTRVKVAAILITFTVTAASVMGIELKNSPVHEAIQADIMASSVSASSLTMKPDDEFGGGGGTTGVSGKKSVVKAAVYSALLPGAGQFYMGNKKTAGYFFTAEALTWLGYLAFRTYGDWREEDYINYAAEHANAQLDGKSDDFIDLVGFYSSIRDYNAYGRAYDPERPYLHDTPENHWEWQSNGEQRAFRNLKNRSREADRRSDFMFGVAIVNRLISVVDAVRSVSRHNRRLGSEFGSTDAPGTFHFAVDPSHSTRQISLTVYPGF